jgi:hypothetical protein
MAKSTKRPPRIRPISGETAGSTQQIETPFDDNEDAQVQQNAQAPEVGPEPNPDLPPKKTPKVMTFFERMESIAPEDWGTRAKVRLYRLAPIIDRLRGSEVKFIMAYQELVTEEKIKQEWGSGRYRLYLNFKMPQGAKEKELDQVDIDILDMKYPPVVPPGEWMDDPRNKMWAWGRRDAPPLPGQQPQQPASAMDPMGALNTFMDIQDRIEERIKPTQPAPAAVPAPVDPYAVAERILNMRSENPMVAIMQEERRQAAAALEAERDRNFKAQEAAKDREAKLQEKVLELTAAKNTAPPAAPQKGLLEQLMEFSSIPEKLDPIKRLFGWGSNGDGIGRPSKLTAMELGQNIAMKIIESPIADGLGAWLGSLATRGAAPAAPFIPQGANPAQPQQPDTLSNFIAHTVNPALERMYLDGFPGGDFAAWMYEGYPDRLQELQRFSHPLMPGISGARVIVAAYKQSPLWPILGRKGEPAFVQFVNEFCAWKPEESADHEAEPAATATNGAAPVIIDMEDMQEGRIS